MLVVVGFEYYGISSLVFVSSSAEGNFFQGVNYRRCFRDGFFQRLDFSRVGVFNFFLSYVCV